MIQARGLVADGPIDYAAGWECWVLGTFVSCGLASRVEWFRSQLRGDPEQVELLLFAPPPCKVAGDQGFNGDDAARGGGQDGGVNGKMIMVWSASPPLPKGDAEVAYIASAAVRAIDVLYAKIAEDTGPERLREIQRLLVAEVKGMSAGGIGLDAEARALRFALWLVDHTSLDRQAPG